MLVEGKSVLARHDGKVIALPTRNAPDEIFSEDLRWWVEVPTAKLNGFEEGDLCVVSASAPRDGWSQASPAGRVSCATHLRYAAPAEQVPTQAKASVLISHIDESRIEDLLLRLPATWAVFEVEGSRPEQSGWHTRVHTLTQPNTTEVTNWLSGINRDLIQVVPWLTPVK